MTLSFATRELKRIAWVFLFLLVFLLSAQRSFFDSVIQISVYLSPQAEGMLVRPETKRESDEVVAVAEKGTFPLEYTNALAEKVTPEHGVTSEELAEMRPMLVTIWEQMNNGFREGRFLELEIPSSAMEEDMLGRMSALAKEWKETTDDIIVVGGFRSGAEMAFRALVHEKWNQRTPEERNGYPRIHFANPDQTPELLKKMVLSRTRILFIADDLKGDAFLATAYRVVQEVFGPLIDSRFQNHVAIVTTSSQGNGLTDGNLRHRFLIPPNMKIDDAFFTPAGLLPLVLAGQESAVREILKGARAAREHLTGVDSSTILDSGEYVQPALSWLLYRTKGKDTAVVHVFSEKLRQYGTWWANRLNQMTRQAGSDLVVTGAVGTRHNHSALQNWQKGENRFQLITVGVERYSSNLTAGPSAYPLFAGERLGDLSNDARVGTAEALADGKRPNMNLKLPDTGPESIGTLIYSTFFSDRVMKRILDLNSIPPHNRKEAAGRSSFTREDTASGMEVQFQLSWADDSQAPEEVLSGTNEDLRKIMREVAEERLAERHVFLDLPRQMIDRVQRAEFRSVIEPFKENKERFVVIGIGGSSQGAKMELQNLGYDTDKITFLEGIDPAYTEELLDGIDLTQAGILVISKSGETLESNVLFSLVKQKMQQAFAGKGVEWRELDLRNHIVAVTDSTYGLLRKEAQRESYGLLEVPPLVGGRFSVLSDVGISVLSLVMEEKDILEFLQGARDYVDQTELDLALLKRFLELSQKKNRTNEETEEMKRLEQSLEGEISRKAEAAVGYQYGGWSAYFNLAEGRSLSTAVALSSQLGQKTEEDNQLHNESLGQPGMRYYRRELLIPRDSSLDANPVREIITLWQLTGDGVFGELQEEIAKEWMQTLQTKQIPAFLFKIPRTLRAMGAWTVMGQQTVMVQSKSNLLVKPIRYDTQKGVQLQKHRTRIATQARKQTGGVEVIPPEVRQIATFVESCAEPIRRLIADGNFATPDEREAAVTQWVRSRIAEQADQLSIKRLWLRGETEAATLNPDGNYSLLTVPLDQSAVIDMNNGSVGTFFAVYEGGQGVYAYDNLKASFLILYGPATILVARIIVDDEPQVYDFIWDEAEEKFIPRQRGEKETSLIEMGYQGSQLAIYGKVKDWPLFLRDFYYGEVMQRGKKVRITESAADLYEVLLMGGIIAVPLTRGEIALWASMIEAAGGRSLIMTLEGPQSAGVDVAPGNFDPQKREWAFFGNRDVMGRLEQFMNAAHQELTEGRVTTNGFETVQMTKSAPAEWKPQNRPSKDQRSLKETLQGMGEDPQVTAVVLKAAETVTQRILPIFPILGREEGGGGEVNLAGDEQVPADRATNTAFRNAFFNPDRDPELERELIQAELSGTRIDPVKLDRALVRAWGSEEEDVMWFGNLNVSKKYWVEADPLDGSSKMDTNGGVSTIFGIYKANREDDQPVSDGKEDQAFLSLLKARTGREALYGSFFFVYGPQTLLYYASERTEHVHVFRLNTQTGIFERIGVLNPLPDTAPAVGLGLAIGGERPDMVPKGLHELITDWEENSGGFAAYTGSLTVDFVKILNGLNPEADGGIYAYPGTNRRPEGRLRLESELVPLAYIIEKVGGRAINGEKEILDVPIMKLHQKEPFFIGTPWVVGQVAMLFGWSQEEVARLLEERPQSTMTTEEFSEPVHEVAASL